MLQIALLARLLFFGGSWIGRFFAAVTLPNASVSQRLRNRDRGDHGGARAEHLSAGGCDRQDRDQDNVQVTSHRLSDYK